MEQPFYKDRLTDKFNLEVLVPNDEQREIVHRVIYYELCDGVIDQSSKDRYIAIMESLIERGAEGIILGCTEIGLFIRQDDCAVPVFDTTRIHAVAAVDYALASN
jgi:aspartate racemase